MIDERNFVPVIFLVNSMSLFVCSNPDFKIAPRMRIANHEVHCHENSEKYNYHGIK
jgi:hypothetical protein